MNNSDELNETETQNTQTLKDQETEPQRAPEEVDETETTSIQVLEDQD